MKNSSTSKGGRSILLIVIILMVVVGAWAYRGKRGAVPEGMVGVVIHLNKKITIYESGRRPFSLPGVETYFQLSLASQELTFLPGDGLLIKDKQNNEQGLECTMSYQVATPAKLVSLYGIPDSQRIKDKLKNMLIALLNKKLYNDLNLLDSTLDRITMMAEIHSELYEAASKDGLKITNFQLKVL